MQSFCKLISVLVFVLISMSAHSASFNCAKASTLVEHLICSDSELSAAADNQLAKLYKKNFKSNPNLFEQQKLWLEKRNTCKDVECVRTAYRTRLSELSGDNTDR